MKKLCLLFSLLFLILTLSQSHGFVNRRYEWWKIKLNRLNRERAMLLHDQLIHRSVRDLLDREIQKTEAVLSIFDRKKNNDTSLAHRSKRFSRHDIVDALSRYAEPLFSLYYMSYLVVHAGSRENALFTRDLVQSRMGKRVGREFEQQRGEMTQLLIKQIDRNDWKYLSLELLIGRMMRSEDKIYARVRKGIELRVIGRVVLRNFSMTRNELADVIQSETQKFLEDFDFEKNLAYTEQALDESWCWRGIAERIEHQIENYKKIASMLGGGSHVSMQLLDYYYNNPLEMEKALFSGFTRTWEHTQVESTKEVALPEYRMKIPELSPMKALLRDIDRRRRKASLTITGSEEMDFFSNFDSGIAEIVDQPVSAIRDAFIAEERRVSELKERRGASGESKDLQIINEDSFIEAREIFEKNLRFLDVYRNKSTAFLKWFSSMRRDRGDEIVDLYKNRIERNRTYLVFLRSLAQSSNATAVFDLPSAYKRLSLSVRRVYTLFKVIEYSLSLEKRYFPSLDSSSLNAIKSEKMHFLEELKTLKSEIRSSHRLCAERHKKMKLKDREAENSLREKVARYEIEILFKFLSDEIAFYSGLKYAEKAFAFYRLKCDKLQSDASSVGHSDELENVMRLGSIFAVLEGFSGERIRSEYATKRYLKKRILAGLSKLQTLLNFYYRQGIISRIRSEKEELDEMRRLLGERSEVPIFRWVMNETNFAAVDKKVVEELLRIRKKRIWRLEAEDSENGGSDERTHIGEIGISLSIPDGWKRRGVENFEKMRGVIRAYRSIDESAVIYIAQIPEKNKNAKEISDIWLESMESRIVKMRWGKSRISEYFWTLSRDKNKMIMEAYAMVNDRCAFVVSGVTTRERYRFFRSKMAHLIKSMQLKKEESSLAGGYY